MNSQRTTKAFAMTAQEFDAWLKFHKLTVEGAARMLERSVRYVRARKNGHERISQELAGWCRDYTYQQHIKHPYPDTDILEEELISFIKSSLLGYKAIREVASVEATYE